MALKSPQDMTLTPIAKQGSTRYQSSVAPQIDTQFLSTISKTLDSKELARRKAEEQKARDELAFVKADFKNKADSLRVDAQTEIANQEGVNALNNVPKTQTRFSKDIGKIAEQYPEKYRGILALEKDEADVKLKTMAVPHIHGQMNKVKDEAFKTRLNNEINFGIEKSSDVDFLSSEGLARVEVSATETLQRKYGSNPYAVVDPQTGATAGELINEGVVKSKSSLVLGSIIQQAKVLSIPTAEKIFEKLDDQMTPSDRVKAAQAIKSAKDDRATETSMELANTALRYSDNPEIQELYVRANAVGTKDYQISMGIVKTQQGAQKKAKEQLIERTQADIYDDLLANKGLDEAKLMKLPAAERNKLVEEVNKNGGGIAKETDWDEHDKLLSTMTSDRNIAKNVRLSAYRGRIDPQRLEVLQRIQNRAKAQDSDANFKAQQSTANLAGDVAANFFTAKGIYSKQVRGEILSHLYDRQEQLLQQFPNANSREIVQKLKVDLYDRGTTKKEVPWKFTFGLISDTKTVANPDLASGNSMAAAQAVREKYKKLFPNKTEEQINAYTKKWLDKKK
jgi:hypothetical protein